MGGCCCSSSRTASDGISVYYHYPRDLEENEPLPSTHGAQINTGSTENYASKTEHRQSTDSVPVGTSVAGNWFEASDRCGGFIGSDHKNVCDLVNDSPKIKEELSHMDSSSTYWTEDDVCPICLEEYDSENPSIITKCRHHFHLSCILEWFERSNNCAICDQLMEIAEMDLFDQSF